jgi:hypothetical protein
VDEATHRFALEKEFACLVTSRLTFRTFRPLPFPKRLQNTDVRLQKSLTTLSARRAKRRQDKRPRWALNRNAIADLAPSTSQASASGTVRSVTPERSDSSEIERLDVNTFLARANKFNLDLASWKAAKLSGGHVISEKLQRRLDATDHVLDLLTCEEHGLDGNILCSTLVGDKPKGLMAVEVFDGAQPFIRRVVCHPDHPKLGIQFIDDSKVFFKKIGFTEGDDPEYMALDPSKNTDKWTNDEGTSPWRFIGNR